MKKCLSLLLALVMLLGIVPAFGEAPAASALPAVGDMVEGFEVKEIRDFGLIGAKLVLLSTRRPVRNCSISRTAIRTVPSSSHSSPGWRMIWACPMSSSTAPSADR